MFSYSTPCAIPNEKFVLRKWTFICIASSLALFAEINMWLFHVEGGQPEFKF